MHDNHMTLMKPAKSIFRLDLQDLVQTVVDPIQSKLSIIKGQQQEYLSLLQTYLNIRQGAQANQGAFEERLDQKF